MAEEAGKQGGEQGGGKAEDKGGGEQGGGKAEDKGGGDLQAQLAAMKQQLEALTAEKKESDRKAEEARKAQMTDAEKLAEERKAFQTELETGRKQLVKEHREAALERMGVLANYRGYAPDVDPRTPEGGSALEQWAKDHPEAIKRDPGPQAPPPPEAGSMLEKIVRGVATSPYLSKKGALRLLGGG